ncbi:antA/AntB antirepressor family protein [Clostridium gasigenes]|uniref:AntA/AntB antirepressor family protein n=2 Tax=Clostridium gasigenes TaxID=94869 RepID=A0A7X0SEW8_9CLOT|nr:antA/AntB antirepressor family protein [Clostridium gasigenes]
MVIKNVNGVKTVSAKELYLGLGLAKDQWSRWHKTNITNNDFFSYGTDFVGVRQDVEGNESMDFEITLEFGKHIAMMAKTKKSHQYRTYFLKCEKQVEENRPTCIEDVLIQSLQEMKDMKQQLNQVNNKVLEAKEETQEVKKEVQAIRDVVALSSTDWRKDTASLISRMALEMGGYENIRVIREESYKSLERRMAVQLSVRLTNKRKRMADEGVCKSKRDKLNQLDVIGEDKKLVEGYIAIVKELSIKYGIA